MLTPTVAAVKFDPPSTPEQRACSMKIDEGLKTFWNVVERMQHAADHHQPIHQVEEILFRDLLVIGRWLLRAPDHRTLCDALAAAPRPTGRVRVEVDPLRV